MFLTSTLMNDTTAIFCSTWASEDHYYAVCTEKRIKVRPKSVSYRQDQKGTAERQKAVSFVSFFITTIHITREI